MSPRPAWLLLHLRIDWCDGTPDLGPDKVHAPGYHGRWFVVDATTRKQVAGECVVDPQPTAQLAVGAAFDSCWASEHWRFHRQPGLVCALVEGGQFPKPRTTLYVLRGLGGCSDPALEWSLSSVHANRTEALLTLQGQIDWFLLTQGRPGPSLGQANNEDLN